MSDPTRDSEKRQLPAWLLGLVIAVVLFIVGFFVFGALGFGDNPVLEQVSIPTVWLLSDGLRRRNVPTL